MKMSIMPRIVAVSTGLCQFVVFTGQHEVVGLNLRAVCHPFSTLWAMMNDPARAVLWTALQAELLLLSAFLIGWYLIETRKLRIAAQQQAEAQFRPALELLGVEGRLWLQNLGTGPALDLRVSFTPQGSAVNWDAEGSTNLTHAFVPAGGKSPDYIFDLGPRELGPQKGIHLVYGSLSGRLYASVIDFTEQGAIGGRTRFIVKAP